MFFPAPSMKIDKLKVSKCIMLSYKSLCLEYFLFTSAFAWPPLIHHSRFNPHVTDCRKPSMTITNFLIPSLYFYASLYLMFICLMDWTESHGTGSMFVSSTTLSIHIEPGHKKCSTNASSIFHNPLPHWNKTTTTATKRKSTYCEGKSSLPTKYLPIFVYSAHFFYQQEK